MIRLPGRRSHAAPDDAPEAAAADQVRGSRPQRGATRRPSVASVVAQRSPFRADFEAITRPHLPGTEASELDDVPAGVKIAAGWAWRAIVIAALVFGIYWLLTYLSEVTIPLFVAVLLTAALWPITEALKRRGMPRALAVAIPMLGLAALVIGIFTLVGAQIASQSSAFGTEAVASYQQVTTWLKNGPLHLQQTQLDAWLAKGEAYLSASQTKLAGMAASAGVSIGHFLAGLALALFGTFYFLFEGRMIALFFLNLVPRSSRPAVTDACDRGWMSLVAYVRAAVIVAATDGLGAGLGAAVLGSNLFLAIGALTFITAFVPLIGALTAGAVATGVVLVTLGFWKAVIMLCVFIAVIELEGHVMQPFLLGRAVAIHPLAVLYGLAAGMVVGGIVAGVFTVPLMAFGNAFIKSLNPDTPPSEEPPKHDELPAPDADEGAAKLPGKVLTPEQP